jgi:hypothetical protein
MSTLQSTVGAEQTFSAALKEVAFAGQGRVYQ